jgi:lipopolysaccharide transport system permease protein/teichoic acid transport system permease protein
MLRSFVHFIRLILQQRHVIWTMAGREAATAHAGSLLGFVWTFVHPMVLVVVFWLVFSVGFRVRPSNDVPFVVWLTAGLAPWFAFADMVNGAAVAVVGGAHLVKKTRFHSQILPVAKVVSCIMTHAVFLAILMVLMVFQQTPFRVHMIQFLYYLVSMTVLALGLGWAVSALNVFIRDVSQITRVVLQVGFWATPVFWDIAIMPPRVQTLLKLNPMFYVVQGYRESFLYAVPFWEHPWLTCYFWAVTVAALLGGALIFRKLKPQFADVL